MLGEYWDGSKLLAETIVYIGLMSAGLSRGTTGQIGPVVFSSGSLESAVAQAVTNAADSQLESGLAIHFANAYTVALADSDPAFAELLRTGICYPDGMPVVWWGRRRYSNQVWERVYGPDFMEAVFASNATLRHYLLGGSPETLDQLRAEIAVRWPGARIVGAESPPFRELSSDELAAQDERIRSSRASMVWVGLGTPKQDYEVARIASSLPVVAVAVGAAFDFIAGTKKQAPRWMQKSGTEWAFRLGSEPKRLWRRYLWGNPRFVVAALRQKALVGAGTPNDNGERLHENREIQR